jgi:L,D-transpeptidase YbiS
MNDLDPSSRYADLVEAWRPRLPGGTPARRLLVVDASPLPGRPQKVGALEDGVLRLEFKVSTGLAGLGGANGSHRTPLGWHHVQDRVERDPHGQFYPDGTAFKARQPIGLWREGRDQTTTGLMLTRLIVLQGLEPGVNLGGAVDTMARGIYFHGTNVLAKLGEPASHGCVRMDYREVRVLCDWVGGTAEGLVQVLIAGTPT